MGFFHVPFRYKAQPQDAVTYEDGTAAFTASVSGKKPMTWSWQRLTDGEWVTIEGEESSRLTIVAEAGDDGASYRCLVTDFYGDTFASDAAVLRLVDRLTVLTQPQDAAGFPEDTVSFTVSTMCDTLALTWQTRLTEDEEWQELDAHDATLRVAIGREDDGRGYRCLLTDRDGRTAVTDEACLTVYPTETTVGSLTFTMLADHQSAAVTACTETAAALTVPDTVTIGAVSCRVTAVSEGAFAGKQ